MERKRNLETEAKLRERVKELSCLYEVVSLAGRVDVSFEKILQDIAELLPPAWQYTEIAAGQIVLDGASYHSGGFAETPYKQSADIVINGKLRGTVDVVYSEKRPTLFEGPFLEEERKLINALAREISRIVAHHQVREESALLEDQLRHADRLATIGQLAAGVAHEINEPLANILGFAQLSQKVEGVPETVGSDLEKIVSACLHAREIVSKLRIFARQSPSRREDVNINEIINEGLFFIESRCAKKGVETIRELEDNLPTVFADPGQVLQVLTNLTVNAIQAMPTGGRMTIRTVSAKEGVRLIVEDTGTGMSAELVEKVFLPFFTTKDVDKGTGLGLSVVQGIVTSHGGTIAVASEMGQGSTFNVWFPSEQTKQG